MDYTQHYGFSRMPFGEDADREVLFPSGTHKEALASVLYGIRERKGYIVVFGEKGMGKTHLARQAMHRLDETTRAALISDVHDRHYMLLKDLMGKLGLRTAETSKGPLLHELYEFLIRSLEKGENVVLFLDDAHRMKDMIIEELRLMSNLETSRTKLIQIVILAEPELERRLRAKHLRQIRQRIQILHRLAPFSKEESRHYIEHRLAWAGGSAAVFAPEAMEALCRYAAGIPGHLNALCDGALALGAERSENPVSAGTVRDAQRSAAPLVRHAAGSGSPLRSFLIPVTLVVAAAFLFASGYYYMRRADGVAPWKDTPKPVTALKAPEPAPTATPEAPVPAPAAPAKQAPAPAAPVTGPVAQEPADRETPPETVVVREGATLSSIATRHYGSAEAITLDRILEANPEITDVDLILAGSQVLLPGAAEKATITKRPDGSFGVHAATFVTYREAREYAGKIETGPGKAGIVKRSIGPRKEWYRVVVGPYGSRDEARAALEALERKAAH
jgi:general secretion pathway protein A